MTPLCATCCFFQRNRPASLIGAHQTRPAYDGQCRRGPPVMVVGAAKTTPGYAHLPAPEWPQLDADEWCGEHQAVPA